jgi:hypothetical protein
VAAGGAGPAVDRAPCMHLVQQGLRVPQEVQALH